MKSTAATDKHQLDTKVTQYVYLELKFILNIVSSIAVIIDR